MIVSWKQLLPLLHRQCLTPGCEALVVPEETAVSEQGAAVSVSFCCTDNHVNVWHASEFYSRKHKRGNVRSKLNVKLATYILLTGNHFAPLEVSLFCIIGLVKLCFYVLSVFFQTHGDSIPEQQLIQRNHHQILL